MPSFLSGVLVAGLMAMLASGPIAANEQGDGYEAYIKRTYELLRPAVSEYVRTRSANFVIERGTSLKYYMTYILLKEIGLDPSIKVEFENPKGGEPLTYEKALKSDERELNVISTELAGIRNGGVYTVRLSLISGGKVMATHVDHPRFYSDPELLDHLGLAIYNKPKSEVLEDLLSAYVSLFEHGEYSKAADLFHYPNSLSGSELDVERKSVRQALSLIHDLYGNVVLHGLSKSLEGYVMVAGFQTVDERYWYIHPYAPRLLYKVDFGNGEEGLMGIMFCKINGAWEIRGIRYFYEQKNPKAGESERDFKTKLFQLINQTKSQ